MQRVLVVDLLPVFEVRMMIFLSMFDSSIRRDTHLRGELRGADGHVRGGDERCIVDRLAGARGPLLRQLIRVELGALDLRAEREKRGANAGAAKNTIFEMNGMIWTRV